MDDAAAVGGGERGCQLASNAQRFIQGNTDAFLAALDPAAKGFSLQELHDEVGTAVFLLPVV